MLSFSFLQYQYFSGNTYVVEYNNANEGSHCKIKKQVRHRTLKDANQQHLHKLYLLAHSFVEFIGTMKHQFILTELT